MAFFSTPTKVFRYSLYNLIRRQRLPELVFQRLCARGNPEAIIFGILWKGNIAIRAIIFRYACQATSGAGFDAWSIAYLQCAVGSAAQRRERLSRPLAASATCATATTSKVSAVEIQHTVKSVILPELTVCYGLMLWKPGGDKRCARQPS